MKSTLITIFALYWVLCLVLAYVSRRNSDNTDKESIWLHVVVVLFAPIIIPFVLPSVLPNTIRKFRYKNRPAPIDKKKDKWAKCYEVEDINERFGTMTIWEYNQKHNTKFGLDDVYGKGYFESLSKEEKDICELKSRMADINEGTILNNYTDLCTAFIKARYDDSFRPFTSFLADNVTLVLYEKQTIVGKVDFCRYWKEWMQSLRGKGIELHSIIKQGNYVGHPIIEDYIKGYRSMYLTFVIDKGVITSAIFQPAEEWLDKLPLSYKPISFHREEHLAPQENRMICPECGTLSESLKWERAMCACGGDESDVDVSMCPHCNRIVEAEMVYQNEDLDMYCGEMVDDTSLRIYGNEFSSIGREFHDYLMDISDLQEPLGNSFKEDIKKIFPKISIDGDLDIHFAEQVGSGDESWFQIQADLVAKNQFDALEILMKHVSSDKSENAAWAIYLLYNANAILPVFWHGAYKRRTYVFSAKEANKLKQFRNCDTTLLEHFNDILPHVKKLSDGIFEVICCYWNDWKGLVRETSIVDFEKKTLLPQNTSILYSYDCGICF